MEEHADGATHMYNFSMGLLAALLTDKSDRTVLDKTGLTGRYSFDIREPARMAAPSAGQTGPTEDDARPAVADALKGVGLELKPAKEQVEKLDGRGVSKDRYAAYLIMARRHISTKRLIR